MNIRYDIIKSSKSDQSYPVAETGQMATDCIYPAQTPKLAQLRLTTYDDLRGRSHPYNIWNNFCKFLNNYWNSCILRIIYFSLMWKRLMYFRRYLLFWAIRFFRVFLIYTNHPPRSKFSLGHDTEGIKKSFGQILFLN